MSAVWKLPVIYLCENNRYGMGTAFERVAAITDVAEHACSYDMQAETVNGMDALAVYEATQRAVQRARQGGRPTLLEVRTYRFMGGHGIVGGHIPLAAGLGFAIRYRGGDQVCLCFFGEAAVNIGAFH